MAKKLSLQEFIDKSNKMHNNKYDYSKVEYKNNKTKVCIICPDHGEFWQKPNNHLNGQGCDKCGGTYHYTTKEWIEEARKIHGNKYDYSKVEYVNSKTKVCIICPDHGEFWQTTADHLSGHGCPKCQSVYNYTTGEWIQKANKMHNNKYDYSKVEYKNNKTKVCIICPDHGEFWQTPNMHLCGNGCPKCVGMHKTTKEWIEEARKIHGNKYDYSKVEYVNSKTKVCIICPDHGEFWQIPNNHLNGNGCSKCAKIYPHSKLEEAINAYLKETYPNLSIEREKIFEWLVNKSYLPLDFYIKEYNIAIEVQGSQHFMPIPRFGGEKGFKERVFLDNLKKELCDIHGVKILYVTSQKKNFDNFKEKLKDIINETAYEKR